MPRESRKRTVNFPRENHHTCGIQLALAGNRAGNKKVSIPRGKRSVRTSAQVK